MVLYAKNPGRHISLRRVVVEAEQLPDRLVIQFARLNPLGRHDGASMRAAFKLGHVHIFVIVLIGHPTQPMTDHRHLPGVSPCVSLPAMHRDAPVKRR